jgi:hypothetical protein
MDIIVLTVAINQILKSNQGETVNTTSKEI